VKIELFRGKSSDKATIGRLLIDGVFQCWTLEDVVRPAKIAHETAIPSGTYKVVITESARFKRRLPLLVDVPGFEGIRIHPGNCAADTDGCILVGTAPLIDWVSGSRAAFESLFSVLDRPGLDITITIKDAP
jgi:hypothetical protein